MNQVVEYPKPQSIDKFWNIKLAPAEKLKTEIAEIQEKHKRLMSYGKRN